MPRGNKNRGVSVEVVAVVITAIVSDTATSSSYSNNMSSYNNSKAIIAVAVVIAIDASVIVGFAIVGIAIVAIVIAAFADLEVIPNEDCEQVSGGDMTYTNWIFDNMMCTSTEGHDTCQSDSGECVGYVMYGYSLLRNREPIWRCRNS